MAESLILWGLNFLVLSLMNSKENQNEKTKSINKKTITNPIAFEPDAYFDFNTRPIQSKSFLVGDNNGLPNTIMDC